VTVLYNYRKFPNGSCQILKVTETVVKTSTKEETVMGEAYTEALAKTVVDALNKIEAHECDDDDDDAAGPTKVGVTLAQYNAAREEERTRKAINRFVVRNRIAEEPGCTGLNAIQREWNKMMLRIRHNASPSDELRRERDELRRERDNLRDAIDAATDVIADHVNTITDQARRLGEQDQRLIRLTELEKEIDHSRDKWSVGRLWAEIKAVAKKHDVPRSGGTYLEDIDAALKERFDGSK